MWLKVWCRKHLQHHSWFTITRELCDNQSAKKPPQLAADITMFQRLKLYFHRNFSLPILTTKQKSFRKDPEYVFTDDSVSRQKNSPKQIPPTNSVDFSSLILVHGVSVLTFWVEMPARCSLKWIPSTSAATEVLSAVATAFNLSTASGVVVASALLNVPVASTLLAVIWIFT